MTENETGKCTPFSQTLKLVGHCNNLFITPTYKPQKGWENMEEESITKVKFILAKNGLRDWR